MQSAENQVLLTSKREQCFHHEKDQIIIAMFIFGYKNICMKMKTFNLNPKFPKHR